MMKFLIFAFLAVAAHAESYYSSYPSSHSLGYGSSLYGASYGSGIGSGLSYGSGIGYGSGVSYGLGGGYGSGASYGLGGGHGHYTTSYRPATYQTARYTDWQPYGPGVVSESEFSRSGPGNIAFTLGGTGYQTGPSLGSSYQAWRQTSISKPSGVFRQRTAIRGSSLQGGVTSRAPGSISFTRGSSQVTGQSNRHHLSGNAGVSGSRKTVAPPTQTVVSQEHLTAVPEDAGHFPWDHKEGGLSDVHPQEVAGIGGGHDSGSVTTTTGLEKTSPVPRRPYGSGTVQQAGGQGIRATSGPARISFTQDFSKVRGQSVTAARNPEIHSFNKVVTPSRTLSAPRVPSRPYGNVGTIQETGFLGSTGGQPQITFVQGVPKVAEQWPVLGEKPEILTFDRVSTPITGAVPRPSTGGRVGIVPTRTGQSFSTAGPAKITFTQDFSRVTGHKSTGIKPAVSNENKLAVPAFPGNVPSAEFQGVRRNVVPSAAARRPAQKPVAVKSTIKASQQQVVQEPAHINIYDQSPVQGFSGIHVSGARPDAGYQQQVAAVGDYRDDKFSNVIFTPGTVQDKSLYGQAVVTREPAANIISGEGYAKNIISSYKGSPLEHTVDKSNVLVTVPAGGYDGYDKSTVIVHAPEIVPGGFVAEKGPAYQITSGDFNSGISHAGQGAYSVTTTPFKSYHSSYYPGYSEISGESPRYGFSPDRSLLYSYSSPNLVSPFSYVYSSGKGQYDQIYEKSIA